MILLKILSNAFNIDYMYILELFLLLREPVGTSKWPIFLSLVIYPHLYIHVGSQLRDWLLYYSVPVLFGVLHSPLTTIAY